MSRLVRILVILKKRLILLSRGLTDHAFARCHSWFCPGHRRDAFRFLLTGRLQNLQTTDGCAFHICLKINCVGAFCLREVSASENAEVGVCAASGLFIVSSSGRQRGCRFDLVGLGGWVGGGSGAKLWKVHSRLYSRSRFLKLKRRFAARGR